MRVSLVDFENNMGDLIQNLKRSGLQVQPYVDKYQFEEPMQKRDSGFEVLR